MNLHPQNRILIINFGSQYTELIAKSIRKMNVYCEIFPFTVTEEKIKAFNPKGIILSGGPESVNAIKTPRAPDILFSLGCPVLGICYGMQTMAAQLGGQVSSGLKREFGKASADIVESTRLFDDLSEADNRSLDVWMSHGDHVEVLPHGFKIIASTGKGAITAMADEERNFYGIQFHPEVSHTPLGQKILSRFVMNICACEADWFPTKNIQSLIDEIKNKVGDEKVILGLSGGVDSSVVALLLQKAIPAQLTCVFVDTGLLRLDEAEEVVTLFQGHFKLPLIKVDASHKFLSALAGVDDPEQKRKIIGGLFVEIFEEEATKFSANWLAQGTIYPDVIESAVEEDSPAHSIKTHHNVGGLPSGMRMRLLEPLRDLFKDEVRQMGQSLGLPKAFISRHPFPGPGLAIRVMGEVRNEYLDRLRSADAILIDELHQHDLYYSVSQAFVVFLPVKSVGVLGDARHYDYVVSVRVVETLDFMTAHWSRLPYDFLEKVSSRIINEVKGISRVTYDISSKPPATIEWE